jgi:hypothetical protein
MASLMSKRFGNRLVPRTTSDAVPRRVRRKKKKTKKEEEREISERLARQQERQLAAQQAAIRNRRNKVAEAVPQVLANQANPAATTAPPVAAPAVDALVPQADPRLQQNAMLQATLAQGDPSMNPNAEYGEVLERQQPRVQAAAAAPGDVAALAQQQAAQSPPMSPTDQLNQFSKDYLGKVSLRKRIMQSLTAAFGGEDISDIYEKEALAKYTNYVNNQAGKIALAGGNVDAAMGITRFLDAGGDLDQALELFGKPGAATKAPKHKTHYETRDGKSVKVSSDWDGSQWIETGVVPVTPAETNIDIKMEGDKAYTKYDESFGVMLGDLLGDKEDKWGPIEAESAQLPLLIDAIQSGQVDTGKMQSFLLPYKQVFSSFLKPGEAQRLFDAKLGATEWWKAVADSFLGNKLKMTKGSISEKEMAVFQKMIPGLSMTNEGNIRLLNMMHALNRIALARRVAGQHFSKWVDTQEGGMRGMTANKKYLKYEEFKQKEKKAAIRFLNYLAKAKTHNADGSPLPPIPLERAKAFIQWRNAVPIDQMSDEQINKELDARGYPSG